MAAAALSSLERTPRQFAQVQQLQHSSAYTNFYNFIPPKLTNYHSNHAHPEPPRWTGVGFGSRHIHDRAPFSLWKEEARRFSFPSPEQRQYIFNAFHAVSFEFRGWLLVIKTSNPPSPVVPLTVGCCPAIFVPPDYTHKYLVGNAPYPNPRIPDPCPQFAWSEMSSPPKDKVLGIISALSSMAHIRRAYFLPHQIVVELVHDDGRVYGYRSLPGRVADMSTTYHHAPESFLNRMRSQTRERFLDPGKYLPGPRIGPLPQDGTNYLYESSWGYLTPGMRLSTGAVNDSGQSSSAIWSTTCGILLRKGTTKRFTVANHGFTNMTEVFHPSPDGDKVGDIVDRYPELDVALVELTPANLGRFSNALYFQAEPPKRLVDTDQMSLGSWHEIDGMSTGLLSFLYIGTEAKAPLRPPGHPEIPHHNWQLDPVYQIFGASNAKLLDGICGAPLVEVETGNISGLFRRGNGDYAVCAALDDLVAEGWDVA